MVCEALSASCFLFLTEASYAHILRHINSFLLFLLNALSSRFFNTNVLFLIHFSLLHTSFMFPLAYVSLVYPGVVSGLFQTSAEMPFEAYIVM